MDRHFPAVEPRDPLRIAIDADDLMPKLRQARRPHEPDIPRPNHGNPHKQLHEPGDMTVIRRQPQPEGSAITATPMISLYSSLALLALRALVPHVRP